MPYHCTSCMVDHDSWKDCPLLRGGIIAFREDSPSTAPIEDAEADVVDRLHRLRAFTRGLLADMHAAGLAPSQATLALRPELDSFDP